MKFNMTLTKKIPGIISILASLLCVTTISQAQTKNDSVIIVSAGQPELDMVAVDSFYKRFNIDISKADNPNLYLETFRWYKTCYRYGGSTDNGIDCSGFVNMLVEYTKGKKLPRSSADMFNVCTPLADDDIPAEGDLVFFKIRKGRISHVGVYLQHGKFAHSSTSAGVIISDLEEPYYKKYFYKAGRIE